MCLRFVHTKRAEWAGMIIHMNKGNTRWWRNRGVTAFERTRRTNQLPLLPCWAPLTHQQLFCVVCSVVLQCICPDQRFRRPPSKFKRMGTAWQFLPPARAWRVCSSNCCFCMCYMCSPCSHTTTPNNHHQYPLPLSTTFCARGPRPAATLW